MHCLQSAAASRGKAFQLAQGQMALVPKQNKLITFAMEGFMGKASCASSTSPLTSWSHTQPAS